MVAFGDFVELLEIIVEIFFDVFFVLKGIN